MMLGMFLSVLNLLSKYIMEYHVSSLPLIRASFHFAQSLRRVHSEVLAWQTSFSPGWICQSQGVATFLRSEPWCRAAHPDKGQEIPKCNQATKQTKAVPRKLPFQSEIMTKFPIALHRAHP